MGQFLIDNNVISNYFSENFSEEGMSFVSDIIDQTPIISVVTEIEALSWINSDLKKEEIVQDFILNANVLPLTPDVVRQPVLIRRSKKTKTPDAIIAATAIVNNLTLISSDKDFNNKGLKTIDPKKFNRYFLSFLSMIIQMKTLMLQIALGFSFNFPSLTLPQ